MVLESKEAEVGLPIAAILEGLKRPRLSSIEGDAEAYLRKGVCRARQVR